MATITRIPRPQRRAPTFARVGRTVPVAHDAPRRVAVRTPTRATSALHEGFLTDIPSAVPASEFETDPYVDYARLLTAEGGILLIYKDLDERGGIRSGACLPGGSSRGLRHGLLCAISTPCIPGLRLRVLLSPESSMP